MRRTRLGCLVGILLALAALPAAAEPITLTLLHVNDTHSHLDALPRAASLVLQEKASDPHALFVHAGDLFHGDPFFNAYTGVPELLLLQQLGLDVLVPGNHELQFGPDFLAGVLAGAWPDGGGVSIVGTNLDLAGDPALGFWLTETVIKDAGGVKVGFIGLTTPWDPLEQPAPVVIRDDLAPLAQSAVAQLRGQGAEVVVCLAHLGLGPSRQLAASVSGIDVIVQGHEHLALAQPEVLARPLGGVTLLVSAGSYYRWVGRLRLAVDGGAVSLLDYALLAADETVPPLPQLQATVDALRPGVVARFGDLYGAKLAFAVGPLSRDWDPLQDRRDTPAGDLLTDAYRARTGTPLAVEAGGFLDEGLPPGDVRGADVFRMNAYGMPALDAGGQLWVRPFDLVTFDVTGADLLGAIELGLAGGGDFFLQVSGMRFEFDSRRPPGGRTILETATVGGQPLVPDAGTLYRVTASEGVLAFLPQLGIPVQNVAAVADPIHAVVSRHVQALGTLEPPATWRIRDVAFLPPPTASAGPSRAMYLGDALALQGTASDPNGLAITSWLWSVASSPPEATWTLAGEGTPSPIFTPQAAGDYTLSLVVGSPYQASSPAFAMVHVDTWLPPLAVATVDRTSGTAPLAVCFDAGASSSPQGGGLLFAWDFGDGTGAATAQACHVYAASQAAYLATVTVVDARGLRDTEAFAITAAPPNRPPVASPAATHTSGPAPLAVQFTANASDADGDPLSYAWAFGDGGTSGLPDPTHTYGSPGTYLAWLTVSDGQSSVSASLTIAVSPGLELNVTRADVDFKSRRSQLASVELFAELYADLPAPGDVVALYLDGALVFAAPFGAFERVRHHGVTVPGAYRLEARNLWVQLDFAAGRLAVEADKVLLKGYDPRNGVDVEVMLGEATAVDNVQAVDDERGEHHYQHRRPERGRGHCDH